MNRFEQLPGETIVLANPKHWRNYILPTFAVFLCFAAMWLRLSHPEVNILNYVRPETVPGHVVLALSYGEALVLLTLVVALCLSMVETACTRYYVTDKRIVAVSGWLNVRIMEMRIDKCETVSLSQRIGERIFDSGDILCVGAGSTIYLDDVYSARRFRQTIMRIIAKKIEETYSD